MFKTKLVTKKLVAWKHLKWYKAYCLNTKQPIMKKLYIFYKLLGVHENMGINMSLNMHYLHSHFNFFSPENNVDVRMNTMKDFIKTLISYWAT